MKTILLIIMGALMGQLFVAAILYNPLFFAGAGIAICGIAITIGWGEFEEWETPYE